MSAAVGSAARRLLVPASSTVLMLAILVSLGVWQLHRLAWKTDVMARIEQSERSPGEPLGSAEPSPYARVRVEGVLRGDLSALVGAEVRDESGPAALGAHLVTPLLRDGAPPVLVDRGWVDVARPLPPPPAGTTRLDGYVRPGERPHWFSAVDDPKSRRFYTLDPAAIGAAVGLPAVAPYVLVALGPPGVPDPARSLPRPPNDHLQYALTWFGFAATLLVIFVLHARKVLRP